VLVPASSELSYWQDIF